MHIKIMTFEVNTQVIQMKKNVSSKRCLQHTTKAVSMGMMSAVVTSTREVGTTLCLTIKIVLHGATTAQASLTPQNSRLCCTIPLTSMQLWVKIRRDSCFATVIMTILREVRLMIHCCSQSSTARVASQANSANMLSMVALGSKISVRVKSLLDQIATL